MKKLSFYVLTYNSEKYLREILEKVSTLSDEIIIVDSGSVDLTKDISIKFTDKFFVRSLDNFVNQRLFAMKKCSFDWVFFLDSDEIPDEKLIAGIQKQKENNFGESSGFDSFRVVRNWYVMKKKVHSIYPVSCPDRPVRLFLKSKATFEQSTLVHETVGGFDNSFTIEEGCINHYTFETEKMIAEKLQQYTDLAAIDAEKRGKKGTLCNALFHALASFIKWYFIKKAFMDGLIGLKAGKYAFLYTWLKYVKLIHLTKQSSR